MAFLTTRKYYKMSFERKILPGSEGEHLLQKAFKTEKLAESFYDRQMLDVLAPKMQSFIQNQEMVFISTADKHGECDASFRTGKAGFVKVIDDTHVAYPDYKGNGVMASAGNISENPHIGLLFIDFFKDKVGLHVNGKAKTLRAKEFTEMYPDFYDERAVFWTLIEVEEAYIHCSKNIPMFSKQHNEEKMGKSCMIDYFELQN